MRGNNGVARLTIFILLGLVLGGICGEVLDLVLGQIGVIAGGGYNNPIRNFFVHAWQPSVGLDGDGWVLDLYMVKLRFGLGFKFNTCSIAGVLASLYVMKWSKA